MNATSNIIEHLSDIKIVNINKGQENHMVQIEVTYGGCEKHKTTFKDIERFISYVKNLELTLKLPSYGEVSLGGKYSCD